MVRGYAKPEVVRDKAGFEFLWERPAGWSEVDPVREALAVVGGVAEEQLA
jgi:hypothetical protein